MIELTFMSIIQHEFNSTKKYLSKSPESNGITLRDAIALFQMCQLTQMSDFWRSQPNQTVMNDSRSVGDCV